MKEWAAEAGVPYATYLGVISVHEAKTSKSPLEIRRAGVAQIDELLGASPSLDITPEELAVKIGLKPTEGSFVRYHLRKLLAKRAHSGALVQ